MRLLRVVFSIAIFSSLAALPAVAQRGGHGGGGGGARSGGGGGTRSGGGFSGGGSSHGFSSGGSHGGFNGGSAFRGGTNFGGGGFRSGGTFNGGSRGGFNNGGFRGGGFRRDGFESRGFRGSSSRYVYGFGFGYPYYGYYGGYPYYGYYDPYYYYDPYSYDPYYYGPSSYGSYPPYGSYNAPNDYNSGGYISQPAYDQPAVPVVINQDYQPQRVAPPQVIQAPPGQQDSFYRQADFYLIAFTNHTIQAAVSYTVEGETLRYTTREHVERTAPLSSVDVRFSEQINRDRHVDFRLP
jgi:hypothetical protein